MSKILDKATKMVELHNEVNRLEKELETVDKAIDIIPQYTSSVLMSIGIPLVSVTGRHAGVMELPSVPISMDKEEAKALLIRQKESLEGLLYAARARAQDAFDNFNYGKHHEQA